MYLLPREAIVIPPDRQRGAPEPGDIADLADSIERIGLLHPPVVSRVAGSDQVLLRAGHTRLLAIDHLVATSNRRFSHAGVTVPLGQVPVTDFGELSPLQAFEVELEENLRRKNLPWQKEAAAMAELHRLKAATAPNAKEAVRQVLAAVKRVAPDEVKALAVAHQTILLGQHLNDPAVAKAKTRGDALRVLTRKLREGEAVTTPAAIPNCFQGDFLTIAPTLPEASFDHILCDPPYGIGISQFSNQHSTEQDYDDSYENWQKLVAGFGVWFPRLLKPNASGYLFCDFSRFEELATTIREAGFEVYPRPFIWNRDGRAPVPEKWPRRCYETILYFRRGDRPLRELRPDVLSYPADKSEDNFHGAKKPVALWTDLMQRSCFPGDRILDPCAGSGSVLRAGRPLHLDVWSIELSPTYFGLLQQLAANQET